jgi:hypothetical protein
MKKSTSILMVTVLMVTVLLAFLSGTTATACTGVPDLDRSIIRQAFEGLATLLVIPNGSGPPVTESRTADGTVVDATIHLTIIIYCNGEEPVAGFPREDMWLESMGGGMVACVGGSVADDQTDQDGHTQWSQPLKAGGYDEGNSRVVVSGMYLGEPSGLTLNFNSPDQDGNGEVNLTDVYLFTVDFFGTYDFRSDFIRDGLVNLSDVAVLAKSLGMSCP